MGTGCELAIDIGAHLTTGDGSGKPEGLIAAAQNGGTATGGTATGGTATGGTATGSTVTQAWDFVGPYPGGVSRDAYFGTDQVGFRVVERVDGAFVDAVAVAYLINTDT